MATILNPTWKAVSEGWSATLTVDFSTDQNFKIITDGHTGDDYPKIVNSVEFQCYDISDGVIVSYGLRNRIVLPASEMVIQVPRGLSFIELTTVATTGIALVTLFSYLEKAAWYSQT
jgi:hypothetical protein